MWTENCSPPGMIIRTLVLTTLLLCGSATYAAAKSDHRSDPKSVKIEKDKDKKKSQLAVSVPDGDPSTALLLTMGAVVLGVFALRQWTAQNS